MRKLARVVFDESHSEAWSIRPEVATAIQANHPEDSSYARAAQALRDRDFDVAAHTDGPLTTDALALADVLVLAHPSDPKWERTVPGGDPILAPDEIAAIEAFVGAGGGLVVLGEEEQDKYGNNLNELLARFGLRLENGLVSDYERFHQAPSWVLADLEAHRARAGADLLTRVREACFYRATTIATENGARVLARTSPSASMPGAPLVAVTEHGAGRVAVLGDSDLFGDDCVGELDHEQLWLNLVYWLAEPAFAQDAPPVASPAAADPHWAALKAATDALRLLQEPDGSAAGHAAEAAAHVGAMLPAIAGLAGHFPHQAAYLDAVSEDLRAWADGGFAKPDFTRSLELFRPEQQRADGVEHLVVFPMYLQNASRDTRFEALIIRVPWPEWLAELERTRYDNAKFVPVTFVDRTAATTASAPCSSRRPSRSPPAGQQLRRDLLRPRGRALPPVIAEAASVVGPEPPARRRGAAALRAALARRLPAVGPRARPHAQPRRPAVRPVHDPPAQPVLDVLARGAALRPHRVRRGRQAGGRGLRVRALRAVRDPLRPAVPLPDHGHARAQLRRPRRPAAVRLPAQARLHPLDRQPADGRVGARRRRRAGAARRRSRSSTARASTARRSRTGSPRTS
jgi:hypothetical protein